MCVYVCAWVWMNVMVMSMWHSKISNFTIVDSTVFTVVNYCVNTKKLSLSNYKGIWQSWRHLKFTNMILGRYTSEYCSSCLVVITTAQLWHKPGCRCRGLGTQPGIWTPSPTFCWPQINTGGDVSGTTPDLHLSLATWNSYQLPGSLLSTTEIQQALNWLAKTRNLSWP